MYGPISSTVCSPAATFDSPVEAKVSILKTIALVLSLPIKYSVLI